MESIYYTKAPFFNGTVRLAGQGIINAKYSIVMNGTVIKVKNSTHIRMILDQIATRGEPFDIIAPMEAVSIVSGDIPEEYIKMLTPIDYLQIEELYLGKRWQLW